MVGCPAQVEALGAAASMAGISEVGAPDAVAKAENFGAHVEGLIRLGN